jgi:hypothetical protein
MSAPEQRAPITFASVEHGDRRHHHYHAGLLIEPRFGPVLRMGFLPALAPGEEAVMPMTAANLRTLAEGAVRLAEAIEAAEEARDARG